MDVTSSLCIRHHYITVAVLVAYPLNDNMVYKVNKSFILLEQAAENDIWNREGGSESGLYPQPV